jgi:hypothetical protein
VGRVLVQGFAGIPSLRIPSLLCAAALLTGAGCSSDRIPTYPVSGKVVFPDQEPVRTGVVEFLSEEHKLNARGNIQRDGSFILGTYSDRDGAAAGTHRTVVVQAFAADSTGNVVHDHGDMVDRKHADYATSGLEFTVQSAANDLLIVVERASDDR